MIDLDLAGFAPLESEGGDARRPVLPTIVLVTNRAEVLASGGRWLGPDDATWGWRCTYVDGDYGEHTAWHYDVDDCGWYTSFALARANAELHVITHAVAGRVPPPPGPRGWPYRLRHRLADALPRRHEGGRAPYRCEHYALADRRSPRP